ncbi:MAG: nucleotide exchange factor GrpE [Ignavibacteriaceae bacterium]|jgi:molecular chaperone GrpE
MDLYVFKNEQYLLPPNDLEADNLRLQEELINERDRNVRALANFKNYRCRIEREGNRISIEGKKDLLLSLLDIIDDFDKAIKPVNRNQQSSIKGLANIHKKFLSILEKQGVYPFECVGRPYSRILHSAAEMDINESIEPGTVVEELRRGYFWNNEVLRPAQVKVSG